MPTTYPAEPLGPDPGRLAEASPSPQLVAVPPGPLDRAAVKALEIQRASSADDRRAVKRLEGELVALVLPALRRAARRLTPSARGSLSLEDLVQVGAIHALSLALSFDPTQSRSFEARIRFCVRRVYMDQVRLHSADVHLSDGAARGRVRKIGPAPVCHSDSRPVSDGEGEHRPKATRAAADSDGERPATPEELLSNAQMAAKLRQVVDRLPEEERELVCAVYGFGRPEESQTAIAERLGIARDSVAKRLKRALGELRPLFE